MSQRIVTGVDKDGNSTIIQQDQGISYDQTINPGWTSIELWRSNEKPICESNLDLIDKNKPTLTPPKQGTAVRFWYFQPQGSGFDNLSKEEMKKLWHRYADKNVYDDARMEKHILMHRTNTLDYGIILSGEVVLILDTEEVTLKAGDIAIQRGTWHAWENRTDKECVVAFILISNE